MALPHDALLPALAAVEELGLARVLEQVGLPGVDAEPDLLKYHPGHRCIFSVQAPGRRVVVKAFSDDASPLAQIFQRLQAEGLASGRPPTVPPLVAFSADLHLVANDWLQGPSARDLIAGGKGRRAGELAAEWLRCSAFLEIDAGVPDRPGLLQVTEHLGGELAGAAPDLGEEANRLLDMLRDWLPPTRPPTLRHGTFYGAHVLDLGAGPGVIDWDSSTGGPLELDAGTLLGWVSRHTSGHPSLAADVAEAESALMEGIAGLVDEGALNWYRAATLVKFAARLALRQPDRRARSAELLGEARRLLDSRR
jgi:hypothetical protein